MICEILSSIQSPSPLISKDLSSPTLTTLPTSQELCLKASEGEHIKNIQQKHPQNSQKSDERKKNTRSRSSIPSSYAT